ncbi:MAG: hypothetical protein WAS36_00770 [Candidatus Saccharimonadales bacterium]
MHKQTLTLILSTALVIVALFALVYLLLPAIEQEDPEMQALLKTEQSLSLPPEQSRREASRNGDTDWKGARHFEKRISLIYASSADSELALQKVQDSQYWRLEYKSGDPESTAGVYDFINKTERACIRIGVKDVPLVKSEFGEIPTDYLNLMGASDSNCRYGF